MAKITSKVKTARAEENDIHYLMVRLCLTTSPYTIKGKEFNEYSVIYYYNCQSWGFMLWNRHMWHDIVIKSWVKYIYMWQTKQWFQKKITNSVVESTPCLKGSLSLGPCPWFLSWMFDSLSIPPFESFCLY